MRFDANAVARLRQRLGIDRILADKFSKDIPELRGAVSEAERLATLVGTKTPGRLVATSAFKVGHGYRVALPVAAYHTWKGTNLEGQGVAPHVDAPLDAAALWNGVDTQLQRAASLFAN